MALTGNSVEAIRKITVGTPAYRSTGSTLNLPTHLSYLALAYADIGQFDDACHRISEATNMIKTTKEKWFEAETNRIAGEIALMSPEQDNAMAEACFERALAVPGTRAI